MAIGGSGTWRLDACCSHNVHSPQSGTRTLHASNARPEPAQAKAGDDDNEDKAARLRILSQQATAQLAKMRREMQELNAQLRTSEEQNRKIQLEAQAALLVRHAATTDPESQHPSWPRCTTCVALPRPVQVRDTEIVTLRKQAIAAVSGDLAVAGQQTSPQKLMTIATAPLSPGHSPPASTRELPQSPPPPLGNAAAAPSLRNHMSNRAIKHVLSMRKPDSKPQPPANVKIDPKAIERIIPERYRAVKIYTEKIGSTSKLKKLTGLRVLHATICCRCPYPRLLTGA